MSDRRKVYAVRPFEVRQVNEHFEILNSDFRRWSTVTHFEDVSYVCSPYLPDVLTPVGGRAPHSDEELRAEAVEAVQRFGESNIRDHRGAFVRQRKSLAAEPPASVQQVLRNSHGARLVPANDGKVGKGWHLRAQS